MLVLTRKPGESIVIGNDVVVTVVEVKGGQVRLGVDAPRNLQVHRDEVYREVMNENAAAARSASLGDAVIRTALANARQRTGRPDRS